MKCSGPLKEPCMEPETSPIAFRDPAEGQGARCWVLTCHQGQSKLCCIFCDLHFILTHFGMVQQLLWYYMTVLAHGVETPSLKNLCSAGSFVVFFLFFFSCVSKTLSYMEKTMTAREVKRSSWYKISALVKKYIYTWNHFVGSPCFKSRRPAEWGLGTVWLPLLNFLSEARAASQLLLVTAVCSFSWCHK